MELRQLRYFVAIAESGSLSRASERLHVAQPALSLQLASLEAECGTKLVDRHPRGVSLTPDGTILLRHAEIVLRNVNEALAAVRSQSGEVEGRVSIGVPTTVTSSFISRLVRRTRAEFPQIRLRLVENTSGTLSDLLAEGALDICILMNASDSQANNSLPLLTETYGLASLSESDRDDASIGWSEAAKLPLLMPGSGSLLRQMLDDAAARFGIRLNCVAEFDSARLLEAAVRSGAGHAILPRSYLAREPQAPGIWFRDIEEPRITAVLHVCLSTIRPATRPQIAIRQLLVDVVRDAVLKREWSAKLHDAASDPVAVLTS